MFIMFKNFKSNKGKRGANFKKRICSFLSQSGKFKKGNSKEC